MLLARSVRTLHSWYQTARSSGAESAAAGSDATPSALLGALAPVRSLGLGLPVRGGKLPLVLFSHFHALATL